MRWGRFCARVVSLVLLACSVAAAVEPPPPAEPVTVALPAPLPASPGYFILKSNVTVGVKRFPVTVALFLPPAYFQSTKPFPVVMTLHNKGLAGVGGQGLTFEGLASLWVRDDWDSRVYAPPGKSAPPVGTTRPAEGAINLRQSAQFIGVAPQCPRGREFSMEPMPRVLAELVTEIAKAYRVDDDRVYLTGFSYGGTATWLVAEQTPQRYAAIAPLSCRTTTDPAQTPRTLKDVAVYLACGQAEWSLPFCRKMNDAFVADGHQPYVFRVIPDGSHWCYPKVYGDPEFWNWLLAQKRKPVAGTRPGTTPPTQPAEPAASKP